MIERRHDRNELATALARRVAQNLRRGLQSRGRASLVLSGGSTPKAFLTALQQEPLQWGAVTVTLTDERWVASGSENSNEALVREHLLFGQAAAARFVSLKSSDSTAAEGCTEIARRIADVARPFDFVVAGMGEDAHTASIFPLMPGLEKALHEGNSDLVMAATAPVSPRERLTLTLRALADCRELALLIHGSEKVAVLENALSADGQVPPVAALLRAVGSRGRVYWAP